MSEFIELLQPDRRDDPPHEEDGHRAGAGDDHEPEEAEDGPAEGELTTSPEA